MTFKELLNSVTFEEVAKQLEKQDPNMQYHLIWYNLFFDKLRQMEPTCWQYAESDAYRITKDRFHSCIVNYSMEDDVLVQSLMKWIAPTSTEERCKHSLAKNIVLDPDVNVSNVELAAHLLRHIEIMSHRKELPVELIDNFDDIYFNYRSCKQWSDELFPIIRRKGGHIPSFRELKPSKKRELIRESKSFSIYCEKPMNKIKKKKRFRRELMTNYYSHMNYISSFIVKAIPALGDERNNVSIEKLCEMFLSDKFYSPDEITSCTDNDTNGANYLYELVKKYIVHRLDRMFIILETGEWHKVLTEDEKKLCEILIGECKSSDILLATNPSLGRQIRICYATYSY